MIDGATINQTDHVNCFKHSLDVGANYYSGTVSQKSVTAYNVQLIKPHNFPHLRQSQMAHTNSYCWVNEDRQARVYVAYPGLFCQNSMDGA